MWSNKMVMLGKLLPMRRYLLGFSILEGFPSLILFILWSWLNSFSISVVCIYDDKVMKISYGIFEGRNYPNLNNACCSLVKKLLSDIFF